MTEDSIRDRLLIITDNPKVPTTKVLSLHIKGREESMRKPLPIKILIIQSPKQRIEGVGYRHVNPNEGLAR